MSRPTARPARRLTATRLAAGAFAVSTAAVLAFGPAAGAATETSTGETSTGEPGISTGPSAHNRTQPVFVVKTHSGRRQIFKVDRQTKDSVRLRTEAHAGSPSVDAAGRWVAFLSTATTGEAPPRGSRS